MTTIRILIFFSCLLCTTAYSGDLSIRISEGAWNHKSIDLMNQILDVTVPEYGGYNFVVVRDPGQARAVEELSHNRLVDLLWFATSKEREEKLLPIRIPVEMGLLGYRVCMINKADQHKFNGIKNLKDWHNRKLTIGLGSHWPDTQVMRDNKLNVMTSHLYSLLFDMLVKKRFDCFSRSVAEIVSEVGDFAKEKNLAIEQNLLFAYSMPTFIFVNKENKILAERIKLGFERVKTNGQYKRYIDNYYLENLRALKLNERTVIHLKNNDLTDETRKVLEDKSLLFDINDI